MKEKITVYVTEFEGDIIPQFRINNEIYCALKGIKIHFIISDLFDENDMNGLNKIGKKAFKEAQKKGLKVRQKDFFED